MKGRQHADVANSFVRLPTPYTVGDRIVGDAVRRIRTYPICAKCDKQWPKEYPLTIVVPRFRRVAGVIHPVAMPDVNSQKIMEELITLACNKSVGCWRECHCGKGWNMKCLNDCEARGVGRPGDCPCICSCNPGCGNRKIYPCQCGYTKIFHKSDCPVGLFKRDSSFITALARKRMLEAGRSRGRA